MAKRTEIRDGVCLWCMRPLDDHDGLMRGELRCRVPAKRSA